MSSGRVLVTGGAMGIGRALALGLADAGNAVAIVGGTGREQTMLPEFERRGVPGVAIAEDFRSKDSTRAAFLDAQQQLGGLDAVIHARIAPEATAPHAFHELDDETYEVQCESEIRAALFSLQAAHACFQAASAESGEGTGTKPIGRIFLVTPTLALTGARGHAAWSAACEAQRSMVKSATRQWGPQGIRVNCIAPSIDSIRAEFDDSTQERDASPNSLSAIPLGRVGDMQRDIAPLIALLMSDQADFLAGQTIRVDGGVWLAG